MAQSGFIEGAQVRFLMRYLNAFAKRMGFENLGIVTKGDAAGTIFMPDFMNKRSFGLLQKLAGGCEISARQAKKHEWLNRIGIGHAFWRKSCKDHGVMEQGLDRPFASDEN